jgi:FkbM family methyltransferase
MVIVQLGANRGYDGLTKWVNDNPNIEIEKLVLVEPMIEHHKSLSECYKNIKNKIIDSTAVGLNEGNFDLYWTPKDGPLYEVTSLVRSHVVKHWGDSDIRTINVKVKTLEQILDYYNLKKIDWLLIDVEGLDAEIALNFKWDKYDIKKVDIEHLHLGGNKDNVNNLFISMGYIPTKSSDLYGYDIAFEKN